MGQIVWHWHVKTFFSWIFIFRIWFSSVQQIPLMWPVSVPGKGYGFVGERTAVILKWPPQCYLLLEESLWEVLVLVPQPLLGKQEAWLQSGEDSVPQGSLLSIQYDNKKVSVAVNRWVKAQNLYSLHFMMSFFKRKGRFWNTLKFFWGFILGSCYRKSSIDDCGSQSTVLAQDLC